MSKGSSKNFICPHCEKRFQWSTRIADRKAQCPNCGKRIRIPTVPGRVAEAIDPLPKRETPQPARQPESGTYELDLTGVDDTVVEPPPTPAQQAAAQTGRCPACNQSIKPGAIICVKCGYNLRKGKRLQTTVAGEGDPEPLPPSVANSALASIGGSSRVSDALNNREDDAHASRFVEFWLPLSLIVLGVVVSFVEQLYFSGDAKVGLIAATLRVGADLVLTIPMLLMGMILAVKLLDMAFGPLEQALFKLAAVVLGPSAIGTIIAYLIGGLAGQFAGGFASFCIYWALISVLFDLEGIESLYLIAIIMVLNYLFSLFILTMVFSFLP
ncbi:MAG: hypothetical protein Kow00105_18310 [Phycisphaeraceae bacterium]